MKFEKLCEKNLMKAIEIQQSVFPYENGSEDLKESVQGNIPSHQFMQQYWLAKAKNKYVGICGLYAYNDEPKDAWLGWFGVIENERKKAMAV